MELIFQSYLSFFNGIAIHICFRMQRKYVTRIMDTLYHEIQGMITEIIIRRLLHMYDTPCIPGL